jgi:ferredoxin
MNKIIFLPSNAEADCAANENIFEAAKRIGVGIPTACNGSGTCGLCRVQIISGEECLNNQTKAEISHLGNVYYINKKRLSCQSKFIKDGIITVKVNE